MSDREGGREGEGAFSGGKENRKPIGERREWTVNNPKSLTQLVKSKTDKREEVSCPSIKDTSSLEGRDADICR